jgi:hypothetical protein
MAERTIALRAHLVGNDSLYRLYCRCSEPRIHLPTERLLWRLDGSLQIGDSHHHAQCCAGLDGCRAFECKGIPGGDVIVEPFLMALSGRMKGINHQISCRGHDRGKGNGQDPCPEDPSCHPPADSRQPVHRPDSHDCACNRMRGADGNPG